MIKCRFIQAVLLAYAFLGTPAAMAGQSATVKCLASILFTCIQYEFWVTVTADEDTGRIGAFGVGVQLASGPLFYWSAARGFAEYKGGLVPTAEGIMPALPASREYLVWAGSDIDLCELTARESFEVFAGHGAIPPEHAAQLDWLLKKNIPLPIDHIHNAYVQLDAHRNPWKVGKVLSFQPRCATGD